MKRLFLLAIIASMFLFESCLVHRHTVGDGPVGDAPRTEVYARAKQLYLFWGLVPLGHTQCATPKDGDYQIKTSHNIADAIITGITGGIVSIRTVKVNVYKEK